MPRENVGFVSYAQPQVMSIGAAKASPTQTNRQLIKTNSNTKIKSRNDYEEIVLQLQVTVCMDSSTKGILNRHQQQMHFAIADCLSQRTLGANFNASHLTLAILLGAAVPRSSWMQSRRSEGVIKGWIPYSFNPSQRQTKIHKSLKQKK